VHEGQVEIAAASGGTEAGTVGTVEEELARCNERYRLFFEMSSEGIFLCPSPDQPFIAVNENLAGWLGYRLHEIVRLPLADLMPEYQVDRIRGLHRARGAPTEPVSFDADFRKNGGGTLRARLRARAIEHGGQVLIQGFARDLTEVQDLKEQLDGRYSFENLIGKNPKMQGIYELIEQVAPMNTTVLIQGESGTGKELVARAIHQHSARSRQRIVTVNCAALAETLLESELFGHARGGSTGAASTRVGRFELAHGGTIFLDEIGDLSPVLQVKLLRTLQEGEYERVGSSIPRKVDARVIAATSRDLRAAIQSGAFREDLYYRLNVVKIGLPALRDRRDDIPLLAAHFIERYRLKTGKMVRDLSAEALEFLLEYSYPGNVRQLEYIIEHAFVRCQGRVIEKRHLPSDLTSHPDDLVSGALATGKPLEALELEIVQRVLEQCGGKPKLAAQRLGISRVTLWRKLKHRSATRP
jgi:PAS domain S-box-containing protein